MALNVTWDSFAEPNITGFYDAMSYINSTTNNQFGNLLSVAIFFITFLVFKKYGDKEAFAGASFLSTVLTGILRASAIVSDMVFVTFMILSAISIMVLWKRQ